jgi:hypothetical protein
MNKLTVRNIVALWLAWALIVIGFQALATARLQPTWPDHGQTWTGGADYQKGRPYLLDPFMNNQVAMDSEYYLGTAIGGYDDPCIPVINSAAQAGYTVRCTDPKTVVYDANGKAKAWPLSYAFFPLYSLLMRLFAIPLSLFGMNPIATATLAGVIVSALGTLAAMLALYDICHETLGDEGSMRAVFYLLIFPTAFFFIQVYTEGLFAGLAFSCLAMLKRTPALAGGAREHLVYATLLGAAATVTRAVGIGLIIPMAIGWIRTNEWYALDMEWGQRFFNKIPWRPLWHGLLAFAPLIVFLVWKFSYFGFYFDYVEANHFGRAFIDLGISVYTWATAFHDMLLGFMGVVSAGGAGLPFINLQHSAYYFTEFFCAIVALIAILRCLKTDPEVAWFSLAVFLFSFGSGGAQSLQRYVLCAPAVYIALARWGRNPVFDRAWTIISILLMGLLAMLFAFNFWVA